jgi:hypothetical protein
MFSPLVIIRNFHVEGVSIAPHKTDTPLIVDAYTVLPRAIMCELMKPITQRHFQIHQTFGGVQHQELPPCRLPDVHELADVLIVEKPLGVGALEGPYHPFRI